MLGDLHLVSPETDKVGQLVSVIKRPGKNEMKTDDQLIIRKSATPNLEVINT